MKKYFLVILVLLGFLSADASHTKGGWMYYEYLGPGIQDPSMLRYKIGMKYYIDCNSNVIEPTFSFSIFKNIAPFGYVKDVVAALGVIEPISNCTQAICYPCISNIPTTCYQVISYETTVELDSSVNGYIIAKQRCCRIINLSNLLPPSNNIGETYSINIPGVNALVSNSHINSSALFNFNDTTIVCANNPFKVTINAFDNDGDSLTYSFCDALTGGDPNPNTNPEPTSSPPFSAVPYQAPFSGTQPLGAGVTINQFTGQISGIAPAAGEYVVTICVAEYRNGIHFADTKKELHLKVQPCNPAVATLDPDFLTCGDLTLSFFNKTDNPSIQNWFWRFNDPASGSNDSSTSQTPNHTFSAAGVYTISLIVNRGLPCIDSAKQVVRVFPGFFPGFQITSPLCVGQPIQFNDTTRTNYGTVSNWSWNFGDNTTLADTSHIKSPLYTYGSPGNFTIKLISANSLGCRDSVNRNITVNPLPVLRVSPDTSYCGLDSVQIAATGNGSFSWNASTHIIGANTATPTVFPTTPTNYIVTLTSLGCTAKDTVKVTPLFDLTSGITASPATICQEDTLMLTGNSNKTANLTWQWSPSTALSSPTSKTTQAFPMSTTTYTLQTSWGRNCKATATRTIPVTALAIANAGADVNICLGQTTAQLTASGGNNYQWSPATGLSNTSIPNPIASPTTTTSYIVKVGVNGCVKTRSDTVVVTVKPKPVIAVTNDTLICTIDTLQLKATTGGTYLWTPNYMISNTSIATPLVSPDVPTTYHLLFKDNFGCVTNDSVFVNVKSMVTLDAGPDTVICKGDAFNMGATGDAVSYTWLPNRFLNDAKMKNPIARPDSTLTYTLIGDIGKCQAQDQVTIKVVPPPNANAGPDTSICFGSSVQLNASGGTRYLWTPTLFLSNNNIANPVVQNPTITRQFIVYVSDTLGCPRLVKDTVLVKVIPPLQVDAGPADTSIVEGQALLLHATGALNYTWSPATALNNTKIASPVSTTITTVQYIVTGTDANGCMGTDSITVHVFRIDPNLYVPTAFTPNGDGINDVARPIMIGMKSLTYFRIYNRFGELVFSTSEIGKGWDGIYRGKPQDMANFVWVAEGVTFKNEIKKKQGNLILIRN